MVWHRLATGELETMKRTYQQIVLNTLPMSIFRMTHLSLVVDLTSGSMNLLAALYPLDVK